MDKPLLELRGLEVHFPVRRGIVDSLAGRVRLVVRAVDGIDLTLHRGEVLALVGESGSGKTTTGRVVVKLTRQTAGRIRFEDEDVTDTWGTRALRYYRRRVQIIFQDPYETLNPKQTIHDFVAEPLVVNGIGNADEREAKVVAALESAGLRPATDFMPRFPHELSGGQRQRVVIAGALVMDPEVIVADEPVSMLDVSIRTELLRLMLDLRRERGLTYLFITHDLSLAWVLADRIAVMYLGKIVEVAPADDLYDNPLHPYTLTLLSAVPIPDPVVERARKPVRVQGDLPSPANPPKACRFHTRCPFVQPARCTDEEPLLRTVDGHLVACHYAEEVRAGSIKPVERVPVMDATVDQARVPALAAPPPT
jgi:peptide/nickel transport system ATP-binding protein